MRPSLLSLVLLVACSAQPATPMMKARPPTKPTAEQEQRAAALLEGPEWYRHAVVYEVNVRSFADSNGDGVGDLAGLTSKLDYLKGLGVDALWLMPIMASPFKDSGYDVADYRAVDPAYGDLAAMDKLLTEAHARKMRVLLDLVLNHTSSEHAWFKESRASKTNPKADWYVWSDTPSRADIGCGTFNPQFGDDAWTFEPQRNQYYFHRFYPEQPDLNYRNPEVVKETLDTAKFWLERGVDGFRCDVVGLLYETAQSCELVPETVAYLKQLRGLLDTYPNRVMLAESGLSTPTAYFGNGKDMFHMAFNFPYGYFWGLAFAGQSRTVAEKALASALAEYPAGAQDALVIGSHDVTRAWVRANQNEARHRRAAEISMFAKGTPFVYYGEELSMRHGAQIVVDNRDYARTPMLWDASPLHGFTTGKPWIAFSEAAVETNVQREDADPESMLTFYRALLAFRRGHAVWGTGEMKILAVDDPSILAFTRSNAEEEYLIAVSFSDVEVTGLVTVLEGQGAPAGKLVWGEGTLKKEASGARIDLPKNGSAVFKAR